MRVGISGLAVSNPAGLGRLSRTYLLALAKAAPEWELHVYFRAHSDQELLADECRHAHRGEFHNIVPYFPPISGINRLLLEEWDLPRQLSSLQLDAYLGCDFTLPPRSLATREAVVLPDMLPFTKPATVGWRARFLYRRGILRCLRRRATALCISQHTLSAFKSLFPSFAGNTAVAYPALSPRLIHLAVRSRAADVPLQVRGSLHSVSSPGPYILAVGVSGPRKNTSLLVALHRRLVLDGQYSGSLILAGGDGRCHTAPNERQLALEAAQPLPRRRGSTTPYVYDLGHVSDHDLSQLYRDADLLANLSSEEGFGYPVLEALAHGTPAFITADSSMTEIASEGIAATSLEPDECFARLVSTIGALPLLRREAVRLNLERYSIERLGASLKAALLGKHSLEPNETDEASHPSSDVRRL